MECLSLVQRHSPRRVALRTLSGRLECSEGGTTGRRARRPCRMLSQIDRRENLQPSVQLPAGVERKAGFIGLFGEKARFAATSAANLKFLQQLPQARSGTSNSKPH